MSQSELTCPLCGVDTKKNGDPFDGESSLATHIFRSTDSEHKGYDYGDALAAIRGEHPKVSEMKESNDPEPDSTADSSNGPPDGGTDPAAMGPEGKASIKEPSPDPNDPNDPEHGLHCPDCGPRGELLDYRKHSTDPDEGFPTPDDYYCVECGQGWNEQ